MISWITKNYGFQFDNKEKVVWSKLMWQKVVVTKKLSKQEKKLRPENFCDKKLLWQKVVVTRNFRGKKKSWEKKYFQPKTFVTFNLQKKVKSKTSEAKKNEGG